MQSFLRILGFITIFIGIIIGIYIIYDALSSYNYQSSEFNPYLQQMYILKLIAGGAIILSSIVAGILYLSFGIVIELLESINNNIDKLVNPKKEKEEEEVF